MFTNILRLSAIAAAGACIAAVAAQTIAGATIQAAAQTAQHLEQKMRDAGIRLTSEDVNAIKAIEIRRATVLQMYRDLSTLQKESEKRGDYAAAKQADFHKTHLRMIQKGLPSADSSVGGYYMEIKRYLNGPAKKHSIWMKEAQTALERSNRPAPARPSQSVGSGSSRGDFELFVIKLGDQRKSHVEFYVNNVKVTGTGQHIPLTGSSFNLRAFAVGDVRNKWRNFRASENTEIVSMTDYRARYTVSNGNFSGLTDWHVGSEKYAWTFLNAPNPRFAQYGFGSSSGNGTLQNDMLSFTFQGAFSAGFGVKGEVNWIADSQRPGGMFHPKDRETASGDIVFSVGPRG